MKSWHRMTVVAASLLFLICGSAFAAQSQGDDQAKADAEKAEADAEKVEAKTPEESPPPAKKKGSKFTAEQKAEMVAKRKARLAEKKALQQQLMEAQKELFAARAAFEKSKVQVQKISSQYSFAKGKLGRLQNKIANQTAKRDGSKKTADETAAAAAAASTTKTEAQNHLESIEKAQPEPTDDKREAKKRATEHRKALGVARRALARAVQKQANIESKLAWRTQKAEKMAEQLQKSEQEAEKLKQLVAEFEQKLEQAKSDVASNKSAKDDGTVKVNQLRNKLSAAK